MGLLGSKISAGQHRDLSKGQPTLRSPLFLAAALLVGFSWVFSRVLIFEVGALFVAQALLLLAWACAGRPLVCSTLLYLLLCTVLLARETTFVLDDLAEPRPMIGHTSAKFSPWRTKVLVADEPTQAGWLLSALACVWIALFLSLWQVHRWYSLPLWAGGSGRGAQRGSKEVTENVVLILAVPATYGVCAAHALRLLVLRHADAWSVEATLDVAELFSAVALCAFQRLLVLYVGVREEELVQETNRGSGATSASSTPPGDFGNRNTSLQRAFQELISAGIMQYVVIELGCNALQVGAKAWDQWNPASCDYALLHIAAFLFPHHQISLRDGAGSSNHIGHPRNVTCADLWSATSSFLVVANFFTCSIALFAIFKYERAFADLLHPMRPFLKFWGVKGLLSVNFAQSVLLRFFCCFSTDPHVDDRCTFIKLYLLCLESLALASLNMFAYQPVSASRTSMRWPPHSVWLSSFRRFRQSTQVVLMERSSASLHENAVDFQNVGISTRLSQWREAPRAYTRMPYISNMWEASQGQSPTASSHS